MYSIRLASIAFVIGVALNFVWEMAQAPLYAPMGPFWKATWRCVIASLGDGVLVLIVLAAGAILFRSGSWFTRRSASRLAFSCGAGLGLAILVELWGLETGRWLYGPRMPLLPGTRIGLLPVLQLAILVPLTFQLVGKNTAL